AARGSGIQQRFNAVFTRRSSPLRIFENMASTAAAPGGRDRLRVLLVGEDRVTRQRMKRFLAAERDVTLIGEYAEGGAAVEAIRRRQPGVVFLDVHMAGVDGFDMLRQVGAATLPEVVFVAAHEHYAVKAFDVHAVDYLLKPFDQERFRLALERARSRRAAARLMGSGAGPFAAREERRPRPRRILVT